MPCASEIKSSNTKVIDSIITILNNFPIVSSLKMLRTHIALCNLESFCVTSNIFMSCNLNS